MDHLEKIRYSDFSPVCRATGDTGNHVCIFPLIFSLVSSSPPPPLPCVNKYTVLYTRIQCVSGGEVWDHMRGGGLRQIKHLPQSFLQVNFLDNVIWNCILSV
jgi:hypothetical protein